MERSSFDDLYQHRDDLERAAARILGHGQAVDDVVQETYLAAIRNAVDRDRNPRGWLLRVARNFALKELRSRRRRKRHESDSDAPAHPATPDAHAARRESRRVVADALGALEPRHRAAITLRFVEGLAYAEIANRLSIGEDAARSRVRRGLDALRERLGGRDVRLGPVAALFALCVDFLRRYGRRFAIAAAVVVGIGFAWHALSRSDPPPRRTPTASVAGPEPVDGTPSPPAPAPADDDPNRIAGPDMVVRGRVLYVGKAVPGARVRVLRAYPRFERIARAHEIAATVCDAAGRFEVRVARRVRFSLEADGALAGAAPLSRLVACPIDGDPDAVTLHLPDAAPLFGVVTDTTGRVLRDVPVTVRQGDGFRAPIVRRTRTDASGRFVFRLRASDRHDPVAVEVAAPGHAQLTYRAIHTTAFRGSGVPVRLVVGGEARVAGTVRGPAGAPAANVRVAVEVRADRNTTHRAAAVTGDDGRYELSLPARPVTSIRVTSPADDLAPWRGDTGSLVLREHAPATLDVDLEAAAAVEGVAVDARTDAPVPEARIALHRHLGQRLAPVAFTTADAEGRFRFEGLARGRYACEAFAAGRARLVNRQYGPLRFDFEIRDGPPPPQRVRLEPCGSVTVRSALRDLPFGLGGRSVEDPVYWLILLRAGAIAQDTVVDPRDVVTLPWVPVTDRAELYAITSRERIAPPVAVAAGRTTEVVVRDPEPALLATVRVEDEDGEPVRDAAVLILPAGDAPMIPVLRLREPPRTSRRTATDGTCVIALRAADAAALRRGWIVGAARPGYGLTRITGTTAPANPWALTLVLRPGETIRGSVLRGGRPVGGARVLALAKESVRGDDMPTRAVSASDGSFVVEDLGPGRYLVRAETDSDMSHTLEVGAGAERVVLDVGERPTVLIAGTLRHRDGTPVARAFLEARQGPYRWHTSVVEGRWSARTAAGTWQAYATLEHDRVATSFVPVGTVTAGATGIDLTLPDLVRCAGVVVGRDGRPIPGANVLCHGGGDADVGGVTDERGRFSLPVARSDGRLLAYAEGHAPRSLPLPAPGAEPLRIVLDPEQTVAGRLVDLDGRPLAKALVRIAGGPSERVPQDKVVGAVGRLVRAVRTDEQGRFRFRQLADGPHVIRLASDHEGRALAPTVVRAGDDRVELRVVRARGLTGHVVGAPAERAAPWIVVALTAGNECARAAVGDDGSFVFSGLPAVDLELVLAAPGRTARAAVTVASDEGEAVLHVAPERR